MLTPEQLKVLGLQNYVNPLNDEEVLVTADGKALNSANADDYFANLMQKVVLQELFESFTVPPIFQGVLSEEVWVNGIKEFLLDGLGTFNKFSKQITIADFNANDIFHMAYLWSVDQKDYVKIQKPSVDKIVSAFTSSATLSAFINSLVSKLKKTWEDRFFTEKAHFLFGAPHTPSTGTALPPASHDKIVNWGALNIEEKTKFLKQYIEALKTISANHLALSSSDVKYAADEESLAIIYNNAFKQSMNLDVNAKLFNPKEIVPNISESTIDLTEVTGFPTQLAGAIDCIITDKSKYGRAHQIKDQMNRVALPKMQELIEAHNWYGYFIIFNKHSAIFLDTSAITPEQLIFLQTSVVFNDNAGTPLATHTPITIDVTTN